MPVGLPVLATGMAFGGLDQHTVWLPPPEPAMLPHAVGGFLFTVSPTKRQASTVLTPTGPLVLRGHDVGPFFVHVPPALSAAYIAVVAGSASKSQFGVASVVARADDGFGALPAAVALLGGVGIQQDCGDILPLINANIGAALVVSITNASVVAGFTLGDFVGSVLAWVYDMVVQGTVNITLDPLVKALELAHLFSELLELFISIMFGW